MAPAFCPITRFCCAQHVIETFSRIGVKAIGHVRTSDTAILPAAEIASKPLALSTAARSALPPIVRDTSVARNRTGQLCVTQGLELEDHAGRSVWRSRDTALCDQERWQVQTGLPCTLPHRMHSPSANYRRHPHCGAVRGGRRAKFEIRRARNARLAWSWCLPVAQLFVSPATPIDALVGCRLLDVHTL